MSKMPFISVLAFALFGVTNLLAQEPDTSSTATADDDGIVDYVDWAWEGNFRSFLEVNYGYGRPDHKRFTGEFIKLGSYEAKLGWSEIKKYNIDNISSLDERYFFGSVSNQEYNAFDDSTGDTALELTRFGIASRLGFGYNLGPFSLLPYHQIGLVWTQVSFDSGAGVSENEMEILNRYKNAYRFGQTTEGGIKLGLGRALALHGSYELAVIYPRTLFGMWLGSYLIQSFGYAAISLYAEKIVNTSPIFGPLMYFVLKNGLAMVFFNQMRENMNWPFETETPLTYVQYKIGASITF